MKLIKIISNATYGHRIGTRLAPKDKTSDPFEVENAEAARLVNLKVAAYADRATDHVPDIHGGGSIVKQPPVRAAAPAEGEDDGEADDNPPEDESGAEGDESDNPPEDGEADIPEYNAGMPLDTLKGLFKDCGLTYKVGTSRVDMVAALDEYFTSGDDGDDAPPRLGTEDPVT